MQGFFKNGNFSHVIQPEHFSLQTARPSVWKPAEGLCANDETRRLDPVPILDQGYRTQNWAFYCRETSVLKIFFLTKNLAFEDVFIWDFVHHCQDCNIKNHTGHW